MRSNDKRPTRPRGTIFVAIPAGVGAAVGGVGVGNGRVVARLVRGAGEVRRAVRVWDRALGDSAR